MFCINIMTEADAWAVEVGSVLLCQSQGRKEKVYQCCQLHLQVHNAQYSNPQVSIELLC